MTVSPASHAALTALADIVSANAAIVVVINFISVLPDVNLVRPNISADKFSFNKKYWNSQKFK